MATSFTLRPATAQDQSAIVALVRQARINPRDLHWPRFVLAVDEQGQLVGCGQVKPHGDGTRELASIAVVEKWRGRGAARAVIEHLMATHGRPLWLTCISTMIPLYQRFGFREITTNEELSPYFRRMRRIARLVLFLMREKRYLAVMLWS